MTASTRRIRPLQQRVFTISVLAAAALPALGCGDESNAQKMPTASGGEAAGGNANSGATGGSAGAAGNNQGQAGNGPGGSSSGTAAVIRIACGTNHTCALLANGSVKCWGQNDYGQLGLGDMDNRGDEPEEMGAFLPTVDLGTGRTAIALAAGGYKTCAILDDASVKCWGGNTEGQLGLATRNIAVITRRDGR